MTAFAPDVLVGSSWGGALAALCLQVRPSTRARAQIDASILRHCAHEAHHTQNVVT